MSSSIVFFCWVSGMKGTDEPIAAAERKQPIFVDYEYETQDFVTLEVPDGYRIESTPDAAQLDTGALKYWSEAKRGDGNVARLQFDTRVHHRGPLSEAAQVHERRRRRRSSLGVASQTVTAVRS